MQAQLWWRVALLSSKIRNTRKASQHAQGSRIATASHRHAACLGMWIVDGLVNAIDWPHAGIALGQFCHPRIASFRFEDGTQATHGLLALSGSNGHMKRQQFEVSNTGTESMPELRLQRG